MPKKPSKVLAVDPGTKWMGYASFDGDDLLDYGVMAIRQGTGPRDMLNDVRQRITRLLEEKQPRRLIVEQNRFSQGRQNYRLALVIPQLQAAAKQAGAAYHEIALRTIRKVVCQDGNASKRDVARTLAVTYPELRAYLESNRHWRVRYFGNALDAIAAGVAFIKQSRASLSGRSLKNQ